MKWGLILTALFSGIYFYPYLLLWPLKLKRYGFAVNGILFPHWLINILYLVVASSVCSCANYHNPFLEILVASQAAYWLPLYTIRFRLARFSLLDKIWAYAGYPFLILLSYLSIDLYIRLYRLITTWDLFGT